MDNNEKIIADGFLDGMEEAIRRSDTETALKAIGGFRAWLNTLNRPEPVAVKRSTRSKAKAFDIYRCVSTDESRYFMTGVYHDKEAELAVATNGRLLIQIRTEYRQEHAGEIILKDGRKVDGQFPNWRRVTPYKKDMEERSVDWAKVRSALDSAKPYIAALKRCRVSKETREPSIIIEGRRIAYEYAVMACDFMDVYPDAKFYIHTSENHCYGAPENQSVVLVSGHYDKPEAMLVIMPMSQLEEGDKEYMKKESMIWKKPLLDGGDLNRCIHHKDWYERRQQNIRTKQDVKDDETIKMVAEFFNINLD